MMVAGRVMHDVQDEVRAASSMARCKACVQVMQVQDGHTHAV